MAEPAKLAVIMGGGRGVRMGGETPKQFLPLNGIPLICHSVNSFLRVFADIGIILVLPPDQQDRIQSIQPHLIRHSGIRIIAGGETRYQSVKNGLTGLAPGTVIFIHDGVRPLVSEALILGCYRQALDLGSAVPAIPVTESLRRVQGDLSQSVDRDQFRIIQTPQTFRSEYLLPAFSQPYSPGFTDDAAVLEKYGTTIHLIPGEERNIKITRPADLMLAECLLHGQGK